MAPGTSPAITGLPGNTWEVAVQGANGDLWTTGATGVRDWAVPMAAGTSPAITAEPAVAS